MNHRKFWFTKIGLAGTPSPTLITATDGWTFDSTIAHDELGTLQLFTRTIADIPCYRLKTTTGVPIDTLVSTVSDVRSLPRWTTNGVTESRVFGGTAGAIDYVQYLDIPGWTLASDRFWFVRGRVERADGATNLLAEHLAPLSLRVRATSRDFR